MFLLEGIMYGIDIFSEYFPSPPILLTAYEFGDEGKLLT